MAIGFLPLLRPKKRNAEGVFAPRRGKRAGTPARAILEDLECRRLLSAVTGLVLVNADTGNDISPLTNGEILKFANLPTRHLSVRAEVTGDTRSVGFAYDTAPIHAENFLPYDLAGDSGWGHYNSWTPEAGSHTLTATPFARRGLRGEAGTPERVTFKVIDDANSPTQTATGNPTATPPTGPSTDPTLPPPPPPPIITVPVEAPVPPPPISTPVPVVVPAPPPIAGRWKNVFADEFNSMPSPGVWANELWSSTQFAGELQNYSAGGVSVSNGILSLTATNQPSGGMPYTSGLIATGGEPGVTPPGFSFQYGYVEARMKLPAGNGMWPGFWMLPVPDANGNNQDDAGEIDIMEAIGNDITRYDVHLHHNGSWGKTYNSGVDLSQSFHTYGVDWEPDHLTYYFDGKAVYSITDPSVIPNVAEYLILDLAIGDSNSWPGAPDSSTVFPASLQVDYVRVFQKV